ncbi:MAG TPA: anti-sigma factor [Actinomycetota bacterium]|jgi:anti-sigma-K factor RskA|nr:anti-sigma factor [Actinomycetota bacterium]
MTDGNHTEVQSLLGAFVLNAVSASEHRLVERHLESCAECAREVGLLREASSELAWLPAPEDAGELVERISAALPPRPRRIVVRALSAVAAVAVAAAGFLGASLVRERDRSDDLAAIVAEAGRSVRLHPQASGFEGNGNLFLTGKRAALVLDDVPPPGRGRSYQLWAVSGDKPVSMAVVDGKTRIVRLFEWSGVADSFAVTIEPSGGSPVPTSDPVLAGS